ncbi:MAG: DUF2723 domain-containing protein [Flavobacteriales bacterium]|nr:DUF2723 domain-containing protein [Flavobacteriales bacterium]MCC6939254.1 DUF2723 domain-containing protein [Flavobacteriales bacterium]
MNYKKLNIITGWLVFLVAAWTYISTIEPTASFWDCGEFIATAYKLEVGHPPGAPLFMIMGRVASAFVSPENVPVAMNVLSALAAAFTILFLFWSITHMAKKLAERDGRELTTGAMIAVLGSGVVGALAYTWSDSFWFSAVEGEVYALSSFFTAIVFWAILKWESVADEPHNIRWLILIAYLMGLSIGVHLLNLLCIPAIAFVYYFKRHEVTLKGVAITFVVSAVILGTIQAVIIPGLVKMGGWFELLFVNDMGMPFNTGVVVYALLVIGLVVWGVRWTQRTGRVLWNTVILGVSVILVGYSTYAMIVIRSTANPPIDENNPENVFNLLSYLNREQYGDRPLLIGQFWDSPYSNERGDGNPVYTATYLVQKNGHTVAKYYDRWSVDHFIAANPGHEVKHEYIITDARKGSEIIYEPEFTMLFPRMYSSQKSHADAYKQWCEFKGTAMRGKDREGNPTRIYKPTQMENMRFFFAYQMDWMYWRYFMWNFAGRQNDQQGTGNIMDGNWLTGFKAIDAERLGNQDVLPKSLTLNKGLNKFYLLPLILGVIGFVYQLLRHGRDWSVVMLLFFFTGVAIVIYLNQTPFQPRERDYAYVGSFYAFALWIGLGVFALYDAARSISLRDLGIVAASAFGLGLLKYLVESLAGDAHAISYILFVMATVGVGSIALFFALGRLLGNDSPVIPTLATVLCMAVPLVMVAGTWDDHDRSERTPARDLASDYLESCAPNAILFTNGDNDTFPLWYAQEVEGIRTDVRVVNLSLLNTDWYIDQMRRKAYDSDPVPFTIPPDKYRQGTRDAVYLVPRSEKEPNVMDLRKAIAFAIDDKNLRGSGGERFAYIPADAFSIPVDREKVLATGTVALKDTARIEDALVWRIGRGAVMKNHFMVLDLLAHNDWTRPIYFAVTTGPDSYIGLQDHFQLEGLTYRVVPIYTPSDPRTGSLGRVDTDRMFEAVTKKFKWGNMETTKDIYLDENILRMTTNLRLQLSALAEALIEEGRNDDARTVLDLSLEKMPDRNVPFDRVLLPTVEAYYSIGDSIKGNALAETVFTIMEENLNWYMSLEPRFAAQVAKEADINYQVMGRLAMAATVADSTFGLKLEDRFRALDQLYRLNKEQQKERRTTRARF